VRWVPREREENEGGVGPKKEREGGLLARPRGGKRRERKGVLAWRLAAWGGWQRPPAVGCGWCNCRMNRGGRQAWAMRAKERGLLTRGTGARRDPVSAAGCGGERRGERQGSGAAPTHGPVWHSTGWRGSNSV
jgi:hypothetical protein